MISPTLGFPGKANRETAKKTVHRHRDLQNTTSRGSPQPVLATLQCSSRRRNTAVEPRWRQGRGSPELSGQASARLCTKLLTSCSSSVWGPSLDATSLAAVSQISLPALPGESALQLCPSLSNMGWGISHLHVTWHILLLAHES